MNMNDKVRQKSDRLERILHMIDETRDSESTPRGGGDVSGKSITETPRGGGDVSGKSITETPRGGGDVSGKSITEEVPRGGGEVSGKSISTDQENQPTNDMPSDKEMHHSA
jgi:hypothetical protein